MMVMTAKVDKKRGLLILAAIAALILSMILLLDGGESEATPTAAPSVSSNDGRVQFLKDFGWDVTATPAQTSQVKIPEETSEAFERYNNLQKSQGYDLTEYAGKNVMRFVYKVNNYPGAAEPVYATVLVYKNRIIGGDVTDTSPGGKIQGFQMPENSTPAPAESKPTAAAQ